MAGITSNVYDILQPTPVPLKQLSAIAVSLEVWHYKLDEYRNNGKLKELCPSSERIQSKTMLPDLPTTLYTTIDKYVARFGLSMKSWLKQHHNRIFYFHYDNQNSVLKYFDDFVCDYTGAIDYLRTARRMMYCGRLDRCVTFSIACTYFFEYHIRGLWPLVSRDMGFCLIRIVFSKSPQLYYWVCRLRNELNKIPSNETNDSVEKVMLNEFMPDNRPSIEYFWNRLTTENRMRKAVDIFKIDAPSFVRFILPKFDAQQLNEFVNENDCHELVTGLFNDAYDEEWIRSIWMYVQRVMNVDKFIEVVEGMLQSEVRDPHEDDVDFDAVHDQRPNHKNWGDLCCEIWNSASEEWKRKAVVNITSNISLYHDLFGTSDLLIPIPPSPKHLNLLPIFLSYATSEERRRFWNNCWADLILHTWGKDLSKIMNLCFENEDEIDKFKQNTMAHNHDIHVSCTTLLKGAFFDELNVFVSFLFSEQQPARNFKQRLLQDVFLDRGDIEFSDWIVRSGKLFVEFVDDAYADVDRSAEFKIQFMSSPEIQNILSDFALTVDPERYIEFMNSFALTEGAEETLLPIKTRVIGLYKEAGGVVDKSWESILRTLDLEFDSS